MKKRQKGKLECPKCHSNDIKEGIPVICNKCGNIGAIDHSITILRCWVCKKSLCLIDMSDSDLDTRDFISFCKKNNVGMIHAGECQLKAYEEERRKRQMRRAKYYDEVEAERFK